MQAPVLQRKFGASPRKPTIPTSATSATSAHGRRGPEDGFVSPGQPAQAHLQPVQMHGEAERKPCRESARPCIHSRASPCCGGNIAGGQWSPLVASLGHDPGAPGGVCECRCRGLANFCLPRRAKSTEPTVAIARRIHSRGAEVMPQATASLQSQPGRNRSMRDFLEAFSSPVLAR